MALFLTGPISEDFILKRLDEAICQKFWNIFTGTRLESRSTSLPTWVSYNTASYSIKKPQIVNTCKFSAHAWWALSPFHKLNLIQETNKGRKLIIRERIGKFLHIIEQIFDRDRPGNFFFFEDLSFLLFPFFFLPSSDDWAGAWGWAGGDNRLCVAEMESGKN